MSLAQAAALVAKLQDIEAKLASYEADLVKRKAQVAKLVDDFEAMARERDEAVDKWEQALAVVELHAHTIASLKATNARGAAELDRLRVEHAKKIAGLEAWLEAAKFAHPHYDPGGLPS